MKTWLPPNLERTTAAMRLFCLPFAGGGAGAFRTWQSLMPMDVQVAPVLLPGRESRLAEPASRSTDDLVPRLVDGITPYLDRPYAIFGHSMGALLAFEATRLMRTRGLPLPRRLFLSSHHAPHLPLRGKQIHQLHGVAFRHALRELGGTPDEVLDHEELMAIAEPILRADFELCETYAHRTAAPLDMPFHIYGGDADPDIPREDLEPWREHTTSSTSLRLFPGGHLYLFTERDALLRDIRETLVR